MLFSITEVKRSVYFPLFAQHGEDMLLVTLTMPDENGEVHTYGLSKREDEDHWYLDSHIMPNGAPHYVHGEGDRSVLKNVLPHESPIHVAIEEAVKSL
jgi:hypothetical protein